MIPRQVCERVLQKAVSTGADFAELFVENTLNHTIDMVDTAVDDVMDETGLPLAGIVPEDISVTLAAAFGQPILAYKPHGPASAAFRRIAGRMQGCHRPVPLR